MNNPTVTVVAAWVTVAAVGAAWLLIAHHPRVPRRWRFAGGATLVGVRRQDCRAARRRGDGRNWPSLNPDRHHRLAPSALVWYSLESFGE